MTSSSPDFAAPQNAPRSPQVPRSRRFKFLRVFTALVMREIASTDARTSLGFLWQLIEPISAIIMLSFFFSLVQRKPPLGTNFPLYYVTGFLPFGVFQTLSNKISGSLRFSKPLLGFPAVSIIDAIAARFALNFLIQCTVFLGLVTFIIQFYHLHVTINIPLAIEAMVLAGLLGLGVGTFNSVLFVAYPVYSTIYGVLTRPLLLASGVIFPVMSMPDFVRHWVMLNPVLVPVSLMRGAFYPGADLSGISPMYLLAFAVIAGTLGLTTLLKFFRDALEK